LATIRALSFIRGTAELACCLGTMAGVGLAAFTKTRVASRETFLTLLVFAECPAAPQLPFCRSKSDGKCRRTEMCGDWVGTPRRAIPTADANDEPARRHGPIVICEAVEGEDSQKPSADVWRA
jgi:hypothetical protein